MNEGQNLNIVDVNDWFFFETNPPTLNGKYIFEFSFNNEIVELECFYAKAIGVLREHGRYSTMPSSQTKILRWRNLN